MEPVRRVKELGDRLIRLIKKNGVSWLEACEKDLKRMPQLQGRAAATQVD
jgi:hypothetical protein